MMQFMWRSFPLSFTRIMRGVPSRCVMDVACDGDRVKSKPVDQRASCNLLHLVLGTAAGAPVSTS